MAIEIRKLKTSALSLLSLAVLLSACGVGTPTARAKGAPANFAGGQVRPAPVRPALPPDSRVFSYGGVTFILVPQRMTWVAAERYARDFARNFMPGHQTRLWSPRSHSEFAAVRSGVRFDDGMYWVGYHRYSPMNMRDVRAGWRSSAGTPVLFDLFNGKQAGPDGGCVNKFGIDNVSSDGSSISVSASYSKRCKPKENSACTWGGGRAPGALLEDVSENHGTIQGFIIEAHQLRR